MVSSQWDVVVVPFPFTEGPGTKRRPALVLSSRGFNSRGHSVLAMITTKGKPSWPGDHPLVNPASAGLDVACLVRLKIFTLDNRLVANRIGRLDEPDRAAVARQLQKYLPR